MTRVYMKVGPFHVPAEMDEEGEVHLTHWFWGFVLVTLGFSVFWYGEIHVPPGTELTDRQKWGF